MYSILLVVFREGFEIALILSVLLAATRGLSERKRWVWLGVLAGIVGSVVIAFLADLIAEAAEGMGQEILNAGILLTAAVLIGWTTIWMSKQGPQLANDLKKIGKEIGNGYKPVYTLAVVIALSVFREGAEIVMFLYSSFMTEGKFLPLVTGFVGGISLSAVLGIALYYGLIRISTKKVFVVTSWMLVFLLAGMVVQAVGFLSAAGKVPEIWPVVWDTSSIISRDSFIGQVLKALLGYTDRPSGVQVLMYVLTIGGMFMALKFNEISKFFAGKKIVLTVLACAVSLLLLPQEAHATKKVYSPLVEKGEIEIEARGSYDIDERASKDNIQKQKYAIGYGVTDRWFTEIYGEFERTKNDDAQDNNFDFTAVSWENRWQLTEQGQYWVDVGAYLEYETSFEDKHADKVETKLLLEKSLPNFTHTLNLKLEQAIGSHTTDDLEGGLAWSSRYRLSKVFQPGFEIHSDFGELSQPSSFQEQKHQGGPVIYGKVGDIKYDIGYLAGLSDAAPKGEIKWIMEYEFRF
jgi:high-affinity iron transporter